MGSEMCIRDRVVGDQTYGNPGKSSNLGLCRQFLHSYFIEFQHPCINDTLSFMAPLPDDLIQAISQLADRRIGLTERGHEVLAAYQENCGITEERESFALV